MTDARELREAAGGDRLMPRIHPRYLLVQVAKGRLTDFIFDEWLGPRVEEWTWEQATTYALRVEVLCLQASVHGEPTTSSRRLPSASRELWTFVQGWVGEEGVTWVEAARVLHGEAVSWLNYALRNERHPDDPEKKADEA